MKKLLVVLLLVLLSSSAWAQNAQVVAEAKASLQNAGVDLSGPCGALKLTNLVAWNLRPRFGLLHKAGGFRAILKADGSCLTGEQSSDSEGFATDYIIELATGRGFDLLGDAGGANNPQWAGPEDAPDMVSRNFNNFREPFDPQNYSSAVSRPTSPVVNVPSVPVTPLVVDFSSILSQLQTVNLKLDALTANSIEAHEVINRNVTEGRAENQQFYAAVTSRWKAFASFAVKYVMPAVAGIFAGKKL